MRISWDNYFIEMTMLVAQRSGCNKIRFMNGKNMPKKSGVIIMITRISWDDYFIHMTKLVAQRSGCLL